MINIEGQQMKMKLINSKPVEEKIHTEIKAGLGIANVQTRLKLLYEGRHELQITNETNLFIVNLALQLEKQPLSYIPESGIKKMTYANS